MGSAVRLFAMLAALAMGAPLAWAGHHALPHAIMVAQDFVPLEQVLDQVRSSYPGHQLSVSGPAKHGGGYVYQIKWLTDDGAVLYITVDAESGSILSVDGGR